MVKKGFSLYDIEQFLKDAGAVEINEKAIFCLKSEMETLTKELIESAQAYAKYAGRSRKIKCSDVVLAENTKATPIIIADRQGQGPRGHRGGVAVKHRL
jgi:histone H3/H4